MGVMDYFKKKKEEREDFFLEFTDDELKMYNKYRKRMTIFIIAGIALSWTGIALIILFIILLHYKSKMGKIRADVYRRFLKKKKKGKKK